MNIARADLDVVLDRMEAVEGWFQREEGELLFRSAVRAVERHPSSAVIEVGSYCGRSTVALGNAVKMASGGRLKVYAIDPHEGDLSCPEGPCRVSPTKQRFMETIANSGLSGIVELIAKKSYEVAWNEQISFIFIDALHDYANVSRDFKHFEKWVLVDGWVSFHDYSPGWPGVEKCVNEILEEGRYIKEDQAGSLVVLRKAF